MMSESVRLARLDREAELMGYAVAEEIQHHKEEYHRDYPAESGDSLVGGQHIDYDHDGHQRHGGYDRRNHYCFAVQLFSAPHHDLVAGLIACGSGGLDPYCVAVPLVSDAQLCRRAAAAFGLLLELHLHAPTRGVDALDAAAMVDVFK